MAAASTASLTEAELREFYDNMKRLVWKIHLETEGVVYNGVCISQNGLILCPFLGEGVSRVSLTDPSGSPRIKVEIVKMDQSSGLSLLRVCDIDECYNHVRIMVDLPGENLAVGQPLYSVVYPENARAHILLAGQLSHGHRTTGLFTLAEACPLGLSRDVSLLQVANLGACSEVIRLPEAYNGPPVAQNHHGYAEGRGAPLLNRDGELVGLLSFQSSYFDFAINHSEIKKFVRGVEVVSSKKRKMPFSQKSGKRIMRLLHFFGFSKGLMGRWGK